MISFEDALHIVERVAQTYRINSETVSISDIDGRVCAQKILAPLNIQPFDNSAMDGFAVRCSDLEQATESNPVTLRSAGIIAAGDAQSVKEIEAGTCIQIMTGAPVPPAADAVVPVERVKQENGKVTFSARPQDYANIRCAGEDFKKGTPLLKAGDRLNAAHILPLATLGISGISVFKKPRVAFLATGRELVDDLSTPLESGQIYNSNRPYAVAALEALGAECIYAATIPDDEGAFLEALKGLESLAPDIVVSSGAVSAGAFDFVKEGLENAGAEILYHKIKLKPGKPALLARLPGGALYFGLPGNPVASAAGLRFFVGAAIRVMTGQKSEKPVHAQAMNRFSKKQGLHMILKGHTESWEDGSLTVDILDGQASFMVSPFLKMDCWIQIPENAGDVKAGDIVDIYPLFP